MSRGLRLLLLGLACSVGALPAPAWADAYRLRSVTVPGGGYLVADGSSVVPLELGLDVDASATPPKSVKLTAERGEVLATKMVGRDRILFFYKMPAKKYAGRIGFQIVLPQPGDTTLEQSFSLPIMEPKAPSLDLTVGPELIEASNNELVRISALAKGVELTGIEIASDRKELMVSAPRDGGSELSIEGSLTMKNLPPDAPSFALVLASASSLTGFVAVSSGVAAKAPIRLSVEIPPGTELVVEGAETPQTPVPAPADGRTVMENVPVRYGARVRAFQRKGKEKKELAVVIPTGQVPLGVAVGLAGQTVADGGSGPSILVAIPPGPGGSKPYWPEIAVEGAQVLDTESVGERVKVVMLKRPDDPKDVQVLLDDIPIGAVHFGPGHGAELASEPAAAERDERGALILKVKDAISGALTDTPSPSVHLESDAAMTIKRVGLGRYRVSLPPGTAGQPGDSVRVIAELAPPPQLFGDPLPTKKLLVPVRLAGPPPALKTQEPPPPPSASASVPVEPKSEGSNRVFGMGAYAVVGGSFSSLLLVGGGVLIELRPPVVDGRLIARAGAEFVHHSGSGMITLDEGVIETQATIAGVLLPVSVGFALVSSESFELAALAGFALRFEQGALEVGGDRPPGGSRVGFGARAGLEGDIHLGSATIVVGAVLEGIGASSKGLGPNFDDTLMNVRAEVGFRFWL